jgi:tRNA-Thr(GGU) m(6)t(6)A37 methyltransferase TsaA
LKYNAFIWLFFALFFVSSCQDHTIEYQPIGYFSSKYSLETGAPRQGILIPESKGIIILDTIYFNAIQNLSEFEYIWVLMHFNQSVGWENIVKPAESDHEYGLFATRSPRRPNPIGLSLIKIDTIIGCKIYVSGVDMFDKTPIIDIKPFLPSVDYVVSEKNMLSELYLGHHDQDFINDTLAKEFVLGIKQKVYGKSRH